MNDNHCKQICDIQNIYVPCFNQAKCLSCGRYWEDGEEIISNQIERPIQDYEKDTNNLC